MTLLHTCTFTGIDDGTDLQRAARLAAAYPAVEFGILLSRTRAGIEHRYPKDASAIAERLKAHNPNIRLALHVCGRAVFELISGSPSLHKLTERFGRVQLNFNLGRVPFEVTHLERWIDGFDKPVITQHNTANAELSTAIGNGRHAILFDASGGAGLRPDGWPPAHAGKSCGFAGGIGPDTVKDDITQIEAVNRGTPYWIDMEGRIRTDDLFDLDKCERVMSAIAG